MFEILKQLGSWLLKKLMKVFAKQVAKAEKQLEKEEKEKNGTKEKVPDAN